MAKTKDPQKITEIRGDIAVLLGDEETWTELPGCSLIISPPGTLIDRESGLLESKPVRRLEELGLESPYGLIALDELLRSLPLSKILEYRTEMKKTAPPTTAKEKKHGNWVRPQQRHAGHPRKRG